MARYVLAAVVGCLYVAVSSWVVHREGVAYRAALRRERVAAQTPRPGPVERPRDQVVTKVEKAAQRPAEPAPEPMITAAPSPEPPPPGATVAFSPAPAVAPSPPPPLIAAPEKPVRDQLPQPIIDWANSLDLSRLNADDERRLGAALHQIIMKHVQPSETVPWPELATKAARKVSSTPYTVTILESDAVNAFSHPGGYLYVCRGLFDLIGSDEDYALEFVLGHEIAHLELKHALKCVQAGHAEAKKRGIDTLNQFLVPIVMGYPDDHQEYEADAWIVRQMTTRLDRTRRESLAFLRKFKGYAESHGFASGHKPPEPQATLVENHYRAHPPTWERLEKLQSLFSPPVAGKPK